MCCRHDGGKLRAADGICWRQVANVLRLHRLLGRRSHAAGAARLRHQRLAPSDLDLRAAGSAAAGIVPVGAREPALADAASPRRRGASGATIRLVHFLDLSFKKTE